jgi:hypothetical protein
MLVRGKTAVTIIFCFYSFHFAKALYSKLKNKFRLGHIFLKNASSVHRSLAYICKQLFAVPLLRPEDMRPQLERLRGSFIFGFVGKAVPMSWHLV